MNAPIEQELLSIVLAHKNVDNIAARNIKATENDTSQEDIRQARRELDTAIRKAYPAVGVDIVTRYDPDFKPSGEVNLSLTAGKLALLLGSIEYAKAYGCPSKYTKRQDLLNDIRSQTKRADQ